MSSTPLAELTELAPRSGRAWLVGGAVRDELLGRDTLDYDLAVEGDTRRLARELGRAADGHAFALSEAFGAWRVMARDQSWQVDLTPLTGETLEQDLRRRDLTINAIARPLGEHPGDDRLIDPCGGVADLAARRLRMVGPEAFAADPLRTIRLARLAAELDFAVDSQTIASAAASAPALREVAPERVFTELRQIVACDRAPAGLALLEQVGGMAVVLPELSALHGVEQSDFHHLDVYDHTIAALQSAIDLQREPGAVFGELAGQVTDVLSEPLGNEMTRGDALRFGALFHDIAKPQTQAVNQQGRVTFLGHDAAGAELAHAILLRLRASDRLAAHVAALARNHLRLGFLAHERPLSRRAVYGYLALCEPREVDVTVLSVADRLATLGRNAERALELHLELAREMLADAFAWRADRPRPPIRGDQLARSLGMRPGPRLGAVLEELTVAAYAGEIAGAEEGVAHARAWLAADR